MPQTFEVFKEFEDGKTQIEFQNMTKYQAVELSYHFNSNLPFDFSNGYFYSFREQTHDVPINMRIKQ